VNLVINRDASNSTASPAAAGLRVSCPPRWLKIRTAFSIAADAIADSDGPGQLAQQQTLGRQSRILERCESSQQPQCAPSEQEATSGLPFKLFAGQRC
jgi:hypothetical protein